ncbi:class I SAM-dependent methyltransferase [Phenylobacterium aquaticum]|uniref:class I SAM-dependent methyltransferase n=1 Tax=Phenylobacterium aquaticum TaxID=1763816 RepID=UPI001F5CDB0F|nr:class I SAM-dependent methyltransferase [Phenylobacterium aquaticum]MCI3131208.1 class I SAM-dependent methyltransferase [Phenylobacterium aquaticum]
MTAPPHEPGLEDAVEIGLGRLRAHMLNLAELIFLRVLQRSPRHPTATRLLGVTRFKLGEPDAALTLLRAAVEAAPDDPAGWCDLAMGLGQSGDTAAAAEALARADALLDPATPAPDLAHLTWSSDRWTMDFKLVDYDYTARIRYGAGKPPHPELEAQISAGRDRYAALLAEIAEIASDFTQIPMGGDNEDPHPFWLNAWFNSLDAMVLMQMLRRGDPARFVEIGSGLSTKFARRAVQTYGLRTRLTSIDPQPRAEVDRICDHVIRKPLEACNVEIFQALEPGDILFLDSSHRSFQGSDVTVFFLEILPRLTSGVIVHVHDVYLPDDYISGHVQRLWNEQYLLATALIFGPQAFEILSPNWWISQDPALLAQARATLRPGPLAGLDIYGASFWMRKT